MECQSSQAGSGEENRGGEFAAQAGASRPSLLIELWEFIAANKKWWLTPVILVLLLVGALDHAVGYRGGTVHLYAVLASDAFAVNAAREHWRPIRYPGRLSGASRRSPRPMGVEGGRSANDSR